MSTTITNTNPHAIHHQPSHSKKDLIRSKYISSEKDIPEEKEQAIKIEQHIIDSLGLTINNHATEEDLIRKGYSRSKSC
jgi:hypothetical protein